MSDTTVKKVSAASASKGELGQKYLVAGVSLAMRLWEAESPGIDPQPVRRDYETVGYVLEGRAKLDINGQVVVLEPGDCWLVPKDVVHRYRIDEPFTAIEATSPPARFHGRDEE